MKQPTSREVFDALGGTLDPKPARSVKINNDLHHRIRIRAANDRIGIGQLIENLLESALKGGGQ